MEFGNDIEFARQLDDADPLKRFRKCFHIPRGEGKEQIYFLGNSLGLQPVNTREEINRVLQQWANYGVEAFFQGEEPWLEMHERLVEPLSWIIGARPAELVVMNQLTINLHLMMVSFYRPQGKRNKIICEARAFPSDQYMLETHLKHLGLDPKDVIIEITPRTGEYHIRTEDILASVTQHRDELALIFWGGVNYYTGQVFDMELITRAGHEAGAKVGFDLAHAAGNIKLRLHEWNVDFACWCSYKYLNSGPGAIGGAFIHSRYHHLADMNRFAGWWGYDKTSRFRMEPGFVPIQTAEGWQQSTPSILLYASHFAALKIFSDAGFENLLIKAEAMSRYLYYLLQPVVDFHGSSKINIITPVDNNAHGCQLSLFFPKHGQEVFKKLTAAGIFADWREPGVIRIAPVPLYNTFTEIFEFVGALGNAIADCK